MNKLLKLTGLFILVGLYFYIVTVLIIGGLVTLILGKTYIGVVEIAFGLAAIGMLPILGFLL